MSDSVRTKSSSAFALVLIGILFFIFGFITWSNSQLIPYLKIACELTDTQSFFVTSAFFAAYFFMAIPSSAILNKVGYKNGISLGLLVMAIGAALFIPAANARNYNLFLTALFIVATGLALLQTASNPYVTVLGPIESAAQRISIMGICNKIAGIVAVYTLGAITLSNADVLKEKLKTLSGAAKAAELDQLASRVVMPYTIIASILLALAIIFFFLHLPNIKEEASEDALTSGQNDSILQYPQLWLGALAIFFYVGVEVISYDTFAGFGESLGYPLTTAKDFATYTGWALVAGYVLSIVLIPSVISQRTALIGAVILSMILVAVAITTKGNVAVGAFALLGFSNSVMWPAIWPLSLDGLGRHTKMGSAFLIMAIVGGATLPPLYASFATSIGSKQQAYWLMIPCYIYILLFALRKQKKLQFA